MTGPDKNLLERNRWQLDKSSYQVIDAVRGLWVGRVTTSHLAASGESEESFTVIVENGNCIEIDDSALLALKQWVLARQ